MRSAGRAMPVVANDACRLLLLPDQNHIDSETYPLPLILRGLKLERASRVDEVSNLHCKSSCELGLSHSI